MLQLMLLGLFGLSKPRVPLDFQSSAYCNDDNDDADDNNFKNNGNGNASDNDNYDDDTKYDDDDDEDLSNACYCFPPRPLLGDREWNMGQTWHLDIVPHQGLFSEQCSHITPGGWGWGWQGGLGDDENNHYYDFYIKTILQISTFFHSSPQAKAKIWNWYVLIFERLKSSWSSSQRSMIPRKCQRPLLSELSGRRIVCWRDIARDSDPIKHLLLRKYLLKLSKYFIGIVEIFLLTLIIVETQ